MENLNISLEGGHVFFANIYNKDFSMLIGLFSSIFNVIVLTPLFLAIVWYEKFGSGLPRTLLNQLVTSTWYQFINRTLIANIPES
jgi:hypothetical protein